MTALTFPKNTSLPSGINALLAPIRHSIISSKSLDRVVTSQENDNACDHHERGKIHCIVCRRAERRGAVPQRKDRDRDRR
jgi:hypothetical protein